MALIRGRCHLSCSSLSGRSLEPVRLSSPCGFRRLPSRTASRSHSLVRHSGFFVRADWIVRNLLPRQGLCSSGTDAGSRCSAGKDRRSARCPAASLSGILKRRAKLEGRHMSARARLDVMDSERISTEEFFRSQGQPERRERRSVPAMHRG